MRAGRLRALWDGLAPLTAPERRIDVVGGVTLVILLLTTEATWALQIGTQVLCAAALVDRRLLRSAVYWFALLAVYVVGVSGVVTLIDNHEFLLGYWLLALGLSRLQTDSTAGLATSARLLIGLSFAFAALWKGITPDYTGGTAFHAYLLFDPRFVGIVPAFTSLTSVEAAANYKTYETLVAIADGAVSVPVADVPGVRWIALGMTWWTLLIEAAVALVFLVPARSAMGRARHVVLLVFLFTTYALAPVKGYGWLLVAMGLAGAPLDRHRALLPAFALAFVLVTARSTAPVSRILEALGF